MNYRTLLSEVLIYVRSTQLATDIRIRLGFRRSVYFILALIFATIALVFFNIAVYIALNGIIGPIWTPFFLACINLILTLITAGIAISYRSSHDLDEARKLQIASLENLQRELTTPRPLYGFLDPEIMAELVPIVSTLVRAVRKRGESS